MRIVSAMGAALCLTLAACGGGSSTGPSSSLSVTVPTNPIPSGSSNSTVASVSSTGLITGALQGTAIIQATSGNITGQLTVTVIPGAPASIAIFAGDGQSGAAGSQLTGPLCTNVLDAAGNMIVGATVTYSVTTGGGQLGDPTAPQTDASGVAISGLWTLGSATGAQTVTASSASAGSVIFTATATASLSVTLPTNHVVSGTSVQASATITGSGGSSSAPDVMWSSSNSTVASVSSSGLITGALQGTTSIRATSGDFTGQIAVTVVPGAPTRVSIYAGGGQSGPAGSQLTDPLCTRVYDAAGNLVLGVQVSYSVATGGGRLGSPTAPTTDGGGIAISGLWTLGSVVGAQTVIASAGAASVTFRATAQ
jgi:hypothetical protein